MFENPGNFLLDDIAYVEDMDSRMHTLTKQISKTMTAVFLWKKNTGGLNCFGYRVKAANFTQGPAVLSLASASLSGEGASESVIRSEFFGSLRPSMTSQKWGHFVVLRVLFWELYVVVVSVWVCIVRLEFPLMILNITVDYEIHF